MSDRRWTTIRLALVVASAFMLTASASLRAQVAGTGTLVAQWGDPLDRAQAPTLQWMFRDDRGVSSTVTIPSAVLQRAGGFFAVNGKRVSLTASPGGAAPSVLQASSLLALAPPALFNVQGALQSGSKPYAVLLCKFSDVVLEPQPASFFTTLMSNSYPNMDHYYREASAGQMDLAGSLVFGWFTLPQAKSFYVAGTSVNLDQLV